MIKLIVFSLTLYFNYNLPIPNPNISITVRFVNVVFGVFMPISEKKSIFRENSANTVKKNIPSKCFLFFNLGNIL